MTFRLGSLAVNYRIQEGLIATARPNFVMLLIVLGTISRSFATDSNAHLPYFAEATIQRMADIDVSRLSPFATALVLGYKNPGDGGGGNFVWQPDNDQNPDQVLVFAAAGALHGRWVRLWAGGSLTPEMAGAVGDGSADDSMAFARLIALSRHAGAFTIRLSSGRHYSCVDNIDMAAGAPGLTLEGPSNPGGPSLGVPQLAARIELNATRGTTLKLGANQAVRDVLIWRHGLPDAPKSLEDIRQRIGLWNSENGKGKPRSIGIFAPFDDSVIDRVTIVGFNTGILTSAGRFKITHTLIDAAGYGIEVTRSHDTSLIQDVQVRSLWAMPTEAADALGNQGYRPGTAFFINGAADGLQINSVMAIAWANGIVLRGTRESQAWMVSIFQPAIETPINAGRSTAGIMTEGVVRRLTIIDPKIGLGGSGDDTSSGLKFDQDDSDATLASIDNVTVVGGAVEAGNQGIAVSLGPGSNGLILGTTLGGTGRLPLVRVRKGSGHWELRDLQLRGPLSRSWLDQMPGSEGAVHIDGQPADDQSIRRMALQAVPRGQRLPP